MAFHRIHRSVRHGDRFGRLKVSGPADWSTGRRCWPCTCDCGNETLVCASNLKSGHTQSCGCLRAEASAERTGRITRTHGETGTPTYRSWRSMRSRCLNEKDKDFARYGARGVTVCESWAESFEAFLADMGHRPKGTTIDRLDGQKGYEPGNCRWATPKQQAANRCSGRHLKHKGRRASLSEWAREAGVSVQVLRSRLEKGWSVSDAIETPLRTWARKAA